MITQRGPWYSSSVAPRDQAKRYKIADSGTREDRIMPPLRTVSGMMSALNSTISPPLTRAITAKYEDGVLKLPWPLDLPAHTEVRITIERSSVSALTVGAIESFLRNLPALGDDAESFARDIRDPREFAAGPRLSWQARLAQGRINDLRTEAEKQRARENFYRHVGEIDLGRPTDADTESIDADLARAYADNHEAP